MAGLFELEPKIKFGPIKIGTRDRSEIPITNPPQQITLNCSFLTFLGPDWMSCELAIIKDANTVVYAISNGETYRIVETVEGMRINSFPAFKGRLRLRETVPASIIVVDKSQRLQLP